MQKTQYLHDMKMVVIDKCEVMLAMVTLGTVIPMTIALADSVDALLNLNPFTPIHTNI